MISLRARLGVVLLSAGLLVLAGSPAQAATAPPGTPTATVTGSVKTAGPLFFGATSAGHDCSASVVHSPGRNLIVTAAHCITGNGAGITFVPGYDRGTTPYGEWTTTKVWVSSKWVASQDPQADVAFLKVAPQRFQGRWVHVEDVTGANVLGFAPLPGTTATEPAYPAGVNDSPIICNAPITYTGAFPTFNCFGYLGGTSGSPFLVHGSGRSSSVVGVIGGLNQGGCYDWNSFSSAFGIDTFRTYLRAVANAAPDVVPAAGSEDC